MTTMLKNVIGQNLPRAASDDVSLDLPVNPLYCILYTIRVEQLAASDTADKQVGLADILADVTKVEILYRGSTVMSGSLTDLTVLQSLFTGRLPFLRHQGDAANTPVAVTIPIFLGRPWLKGTECFPATRRGELTFHRVWNATLTRQVTTTITEQIETIELLDATPATFLKAVTLSKTFATSGDNDLDLPLGNPIAGLLLYGTTGFTATTCVATWLKTKLLVDNVEYHTALSNWETLQGQLHQLIDANSEMQAHTHTENLAAAYAADVASAKPRTTESILDNYGYVDFDPWRNDSMLLSTAGRGRVHLRATAGTADAARVIPLEVLKVSSA
jgi:hypothetical protein